MMNPSFHPATVSTVSPALEQRTLNELRKAHIIIADHTVIQSGSCEELLNCFGPGLRRYGKKVLIPSTAMVRLKQEAHTDPAARHALEALSKFYDYGIADKMEDNAPADTPERDAVLALIVLIRRTSDNHPRQILLLSEDEDLMQECARLNSLHSQRGGMVIVKRIGRNGILCQPAFLHKSVPAAPSLPADTLLPLDVVPVEGDEVWDVGHTTSIHLGRRIGGGGEADIYEVEGYPTLLAKIYHADRHTLSRWQKVEKLTALDWDDPRVKKPLLTLYGSTAESSPGAGFCGFLMNTAQGIPLAETVFIPHQLEQDHPDWNKYHLVLMAIAILDVLFEAHRRGLLVGDLSGNNILVGDTPDQITFVDVDSWCVGHFNTEVETEGFLAPELIRTSHPDQRTLESEYFSLAVLLFELLVTPGRSPYADGGDLLQNTLEGRFAYPLHADSDIMPPAPFIYCWSHIPFLMKDLFYQTLSANGARYAPEKRPTVQEWRRACVTWKRMFDTDHIADRESYRILPTRHKIPFGSKAVTCTLCGKSVEQDYSRQAADGKWYCRACLNIAVETPCACGAPIRYSNYDLYIRRIPCPEHCAECAARLQAPPRVTVSRNHPTHASLDQLLQRNESYTL